MALVKPYISKRQRKKEAEGSLKDSHVEDEAPVTKLYKTSNSVKTGDERSCYAEQFTGESKIKSGEKIATSLTRNYLPKSCISKSKHHKNVVNCLRWSNNNTEACLLLSASMDGTVGIWRWAKELSSIQKSLTIHSGAVRDARWSNCGKYVLSGGYDKHARITDVETGKESSCFKHKDFVSSVLYHHKLPNIFLTGTSSDGIYATDARSGKHIHHYKSFFGQIQDILFHPDGKTFFTAAEILKRNSLDKTIIAWDFDTTAMVSNQISQEAYACSSLQNHPSDGCFLAQFGSGYISIFSNSSPYKLNKYKRFGGHQTAGFNIGFSICPDGRYVVSGDREGTIHIYDYRSSQLLNKLNAYSSACMDVAYHPILPNVVASCSWDGEVSFWE